MLNIRFALIIAFDPLVTAADCALTPSRDATRGNFHLINSRASPNWKVSMKNGPAILVSCVALASCQKTSEAPAAANASASTPPAACVQPAEPTQAERERARKQAALDYATMEERFLGDTRGQWAQAATATTTFGESGSNGASDVNKPMNLAGRPDGRHWTNDRQDMGFDSLETTYEKPVRATEIRAVFQGGIGAVSKVEVKGVDGNYSTVWTGINEEPVNQGEPRHWFVRKFEMTAGPVNAVKITLANTVERGYKVVDAVQLVGD
jgi:hypothetical protein